MVMTLATTTFAVRSHAPAVRESPEYVPLGAFLGSGEEGVARIGPFERWLGSTVTVGRTYLPGDDWSGVEGPPRMLLAWARWQAADPRRMLVLNVPMMAPNEAALPVPVVRSLLRGGASGAFDHHYRTLAGRLVSVGAEDTVIVLGWEMNGATYTGRCAPDPRGLEGVLAADRHDHAGGSRHAFPLRFHAERGARTRFPGRSATRATTSSTSSGCDSYDQPAGASFEDARERAVRAAGAGRIRRRARQADLVPRMGPVPQRRQP